MCTDERRKQRRELLLFALDKIIIGILAAGAVLVLQIVIEDSRKTQDVLKDLLVPRTLTEQLREQTTKVVLALRNHATRGFADDPAARDALDGSCKQIATLVDQIDHSVPGKNRAANASNAQRKAPKSASYARPQWKRQRTTF